MANTSPTTSASQPKPSAPGWVSVGGLAILANPRGFVSTKTIVFDAQLYVGPTDQDLPLIGSLRYFNSKNMSFSNDPHLYSISTTVSIITC